MRYFTIPNSYTSCVPYMSQVYAKPRASQRSEIQIYIYINTHDEGLSKQMKHTIKEKEANTKSHHQTWIKFTWIKVIANTYPQTHTHTHNTSYAATKNKKKNNYTALRQIAFARVCSVLFFVLFFKFKVAIFGRATGDSVINGCEIISRLGLSVVMDDIFFCTIKLVSVKVFMILCKKNFVKIRYKLH